VLWSSKPADAYLIHPHHLDLADDLTAHDLTSRLERPQFKQVIEADIVSPKLGTRAHAQDIDAGFVEAGKPPYARRAATTAFLHSLVQTGQSGVDPADLRLAVLTPGDDPALVDKATQALIDNCWFFDWDGFRYRFKTEASLRKIVDDEMQMVGRVKSKTELDERIKKVWRKGVFDPKPFPAEPIAVDDDSQAPKLAIVHYDAATLSAADQAPPELVVKLFEYKGGTDEYRTYKNNVLFLVADTDQVDHMVEVAQRYLAVRRIVGDSDRMKDFNEEQAKKLKKMAESSELDVRIAITKAYRYLFYPSADAPKSHGNLVREVLPAQDQGDIERDQSEVILRVLKSESVGKVLTADSEKVLSPQYVKAKAWPPSAVSMTTDELRRAFAQRLGLKMLLDVNQLKRTIKEGINKGIWLYYPTDEAIAYGPDSPAPLIDISEDAVLYTPEEAKRLGIKIKGVGAEAKTCPVCGQWPCECGQPSEGDGPKPEVQVTAEGTPAQAFRKVADTCHDRKAETLRQITLRIDGLGKEAARDARSAGLAIPQMGKASFAVEQEMKAEFGAAERISVVFNGSWDRYKRVKTLTDAVGQEASNVSVRMVVRAGFDEPLRIDSEQFETIRDVLENLGMGKLTIEAEIARPDEGERA
jgi:hypothetical protein